MQPNLLLVCYVVNNLNRVCLFEAVHFIYLIVSLGNKTMTSLLVYNKNTFYLS